MCPCVCSPWVFYLLRFPLVPESSGGDSGDADLPLQLWAVLEMHPYWTLARCQCPLLFCWHAATAAKAILCDLNTAVMDNPLQTLSFIMMVILKHHILSQKLSMFTEDYWSSSSVSFTSMLSFLMGLSSHLSGTPVVSPLCPVTVFW